LTYAHLISIQSSRYSIFQFYQIYHYSRLAFCLFCALPPLRIFFTWIIFLVTAALFMLYLGQNYAYVVKKLLTDVMRAQTTRTRTPVLAITFRVPMKSVGAYLNPHISAESRRMKTTRLPYFIVSLRRFIFRSQKYFSLKSSPPTAMMTS
jgi:hypothetical protein